MTGKKDKKRKKREEGGRSLECKRGSMTRVLTMVCINRMLKAMEMEIHFEKATRQNERS